MDRQAWFAMSTEIKNWDAIFVGAGITSLACAALLAKKNPGIKLLLVDKHIVAGGYASVFSRPKANATFDCSLHKLSGMQHQGNLQRIFEYLGLDNALELVYPEDYFCSFFDDHSLPLPNDANGVEKLLCKQFPAESKGIKTFFEQVRTFGRNGYYQFQMQEGSFEPDIAQLRYAHKNLKNITVEQGLDELFDDQKLKEILAAPGIYVGGYPEDLGYLYYLHVVYATLNKGNAYVKGASQNLSNTLAKQIEDAGGKIQLGTKVEEILVDDNLCVKGIQTKRGNFYSDRVYVNVSPHYAIEHLFDEKIDFTDIKEKLRALKPARSTTTVYLTTDCSPQELGVIHSESMIFSSQLCNAAVQRKAAELNDFDEQLSEEAFWKHSPMEVTNYYKLDSAGGYVICLNVLDSIKHWPMRRTQPYREKKQRAAEIMTQRLINHVPQLEGRINYSEVSSPHTYVKFTNNTDGSGYGAMVSTDLSGHLFHRKFPVKGVEFVSAWVAGPSYEAAFGYAEMKAKKWRAA